MTPEIPRRLAVSNFIIDMNINILKESLNDIKDDFEELKYLSKSARAKIDIFISEIKNQKKYIGKEAFDISIREANIIRIQLTDISSKIKVYAKQAQNTKYSDHLPDELIEAKDNILNTIRTIYGLLGSVITSTDWQSPSSSFSVFSEAGRQTGKIKNTLNDYKRDIHLDEESYEKAFLKEYIDGFMKYGIHVYMTSSGMSAFTTILNFLLGEGKLKGKILAGQSSYFQYKQLLSGILKDQIIWIDESNTPKIIESVGKFHPGAIFLDSLCNASSIPVPDIREIIKYLIHNTANDTYLVIDNTCLGPSFQPIPQVKGKSKKLHIIVFESLMKYHHFGLDRATGGIIYAWGKNTYKLYDWRKNSGTNIADSSVYSFPKPTKLMLQLRIGRFQRNTFYLASSLQKYITEGNNNCIEKIVYPGLPNHHAYQQMKNNRFQGSFFNMEFKKKSINEYKKFLKLVLDEAKKKKVQMVVGTSFGLNHTRIYLTSLWTDQGEPFIRIAVGTENRWQLEKIKEILISAIDKIEKPMLPCFET